MKVSGKAKEMNSFFSRENIIRGHAQKLKRRRKPETDKYDWFTSCGASDAMIFFSTPSRGQQVLTPLGSVQTTSKLVVLIVVSEKRVCTAAIKIFIAAKSNPYLVSNRPVFKRFAYFTENL